jgi:NAD(P)-dependent dehydrogenase (short-subunit alcohol dehydrogenase family)
MTALSGKRALVTGGGSGIGRATCLALAAAGAEVAVNDLGLAAAQATCDLITGQGGRAFPLVGSVADPADVRRFFAELDDHPGALDILVNNAGISGNKPTLEITDEEWRRVVSINQDGIFYCAREAGRRMRDQGGGAIVNIGSIYSIVAAPNRLSYCATKAAVGMMTKSLALEWAEYGIRVNCVAPGYADTPLIHQLAAEGRVDVAALQRRTPQKRLALLEEIADAVLYLCEPRAAHITGHILAVDGGWTANGYL